jgi:hypothetical protein
MACENGQRVQHLRDPDVEIYIGDVRNLGEIPSGASSWGERIRKKYAASPRTRQDGARGSLAELATTMSPSA